VPKDNTNDGSRTGSGRAVPIGLHMMGRHFDEDTLLRLAHSLEVGYMSDKVKLPLAFFDPFGGVHTPASIFAASVQSTLCPPKPSPVPVPVPDPGKVHDDPFAEIEVKMLLSLIWWNMVEPIEHAVPVEDDHAHVEAHVEAHDEAHDDGFVDSEATDTAKPNEQSGDPKPKIGSRQFEEEKRRKREEAKKRREEKLDAIKKQ
jgi:hypothetical protein